MLKGDTPVVIRAFARASQDQDEKRQGVAGSALSPDGQVIGKARRSHVPGTG